MIHRTEAISFPRSGQHLLADMLAAYLGEEFQYCEFYLEPGRRLAVRSETNYQKNHDFDLDWPITPDHRYVIQIRDPFEALTSLYELEGGGAGPEWFDAKWDYYMGFVRKWILNDVPNRIVVHYQDLVDLPVETLSRVITHISDHRLDGTRVHRTVSAVGPRGRAGVRRNCIFSPKDVL